MSAATASSGGAPVLKSEEGKRAWQAHAGSFSAELRAVGDELVSLDQSHLFAGWGTDSGTDADKKRRFLEQVAQVQSAYIGANPYEGFRVEEPSDAVRIESEADFDKYEAIGVQKAVEHTAFVIVAGGLGERLGYKGIKLALPSDIATEASYIELYISYILALQSRARISSGKPHLELQFAIMTSDDTDKMTRDLLAKHNRFGMSATQLTIFKQGKVPSLLDNDAHFVLDESDPFTLDTKPHGHGDVHSLLYKEGIVERWVAGKPGNDGKQWSNDPTSSASSSFSSSSSSATVAPVHWIVFFQDTNGLVFHSIPSALGVSVQRKLHMNSITVPRAQGDAVGAICTLIREKPLSDKELSDGGDSVLPNKLTINVEYNQLEGLLGKGVKEPLAAGTTNSVYPGNINVLILNAPDYYKVLQAKKGAISEFCNPKYSADKQSFKKPTRLECMMQDYPKLLDKSALVSFTQFARAHAFSAVKNALEDGAAKQKGGNAPEVAATGEQDMYAWYSTLLSSAGARIETQAEHSYGGVRVAFPPQIILDPSVGVTRAELREKVASDAKHVSVSGRSTLLLAGEDVRITGPLNVDGALIVHAVPGAKKYLIRGYTLTRKEQSYFVFSKPGEYVLDDTTKSQHENKHAFVFPSRR